MTTAATAFDQLAATYDAVWTKSAVGMSQRVAVWRRIDPLFRPGDSILDLGCGTGEDALHLQSNGIDVFAIDISSEMVRVARSRGVDAHQIAIHNIGNILREFDGAICNFGALNCVDRLEDVAHALASLIQSGGYLAICLIGPCCLWETIYFLLHGTFRKAFRRFTRGKVASSIGVEVTYPTTKRFRQIFSGEFRLIGWSGVGLCVPPSYVRVLSVQTLYRLSRIDERIAHLPFFRAFCDHRLLIFKRL